MGTEKLRIDADSANVRSALDAIVGITKSANKKMLDDARKTHDGMKKSLRDLIRETATLALNTKRLNDSVSKSKQTAERATTRAAQSELKARLNAEEMVARSQLRIMANVANTHSKIEQQKTQATKYELARRAHIEQVANQESQRRVRQGGGGGMNYRSSWGQATVNLTGGVRQFGSAVHQGVQGVRERRAQSGRTLNEALFQAGSDSTTAIGERERVYQFARENRMDSSAVADAISAAQTEFSVLGNSRTSRNDRMSNLNAVLGDTLFARDTGQNVGEVARLSGMLEQAGITGSNKRNTLLALTGMAQRGAVELRSVTSTAMGPMQGRMATAVSRLRARNPNASESDIAQANQQAVLQTFAEMEVAKGLGATPRATGNIMRILENRLRDPNVQNRMLSNIRNAAGTTQEQRTHAENTLFSGTGRNRRLREEFSNSPYAFATGAQRAFRGNTEMFSNVFGGSGRDGNSQSLQQNWRGMLALLMGGANVGGAHGDRVAQLMSGTSTAFTQDDVARGRGLFGGDALSVLTGETETHDSALSDNTSELVKLSNRFAAWTSNNPVASAGMTAAGGALGGSLLTRLGSFRVLGGGGAALVGEGASIAGGGSLAGGGLLAGGAGASVNPVTAIAAPIIAAVGAAALESSNISDRTGTTTDDRAYAALVGGDDERVIGDQADAAQHDAQSFGNQSAINSRFGRAMGAFGSVGEAPVITLSPETIAALRNTPMQVQVDPHDAEHLGSANNSQSRIAGE